MLTAAQNKIIKEDRLEEVAARTGTYLQNRLYEIEAKYPKIVSNTRGLGTYLAFSSETAAIRDELTVRMKSEGVN